MQATKNRIEVMQAYVDGRQIQAHIGNEWADITGEPSWSWFQTAYRVKPLEADSINWDHVAPHLKYMARDNNGAVYLFEDLPAYGQFTWNANGGNQRAEGFSSLVIGGKAWRESLVERPEASA